MLKKLPLDPNKELFRWGPLMVKYFYCADFFYAVTKAFKPTYMQEYWPRTLALFRGNEFVWINDFKKIREIGAKVFQKEVLGANYARCRRVWRSQVKKLLVLEKRIARLKLSSLTNLELTNLFSETNSILIDFWLPTVPAELGNYGSAEFLEAKLLKFLKDAEKAREATRVLTVSDKPSFFQEEEMALQETNNLKLHQQKYFWLKNSYAGTENLTLNFFRERKNNLSQNLRKEQEKRAKQIRAEKKKLIRKYRFPITLVKIARRVEEAMEWQDERKKEVWRALHYKQLLLNEAEKRTGNKALARYGLWEIAEILRGKKKTRKKNYGFILDRGKLKELASKTVIKYFNLFTREKITSKEEIKGIIANVGKTRGKVKIVRDPKSMDSKFKKGEILVAPMTSPDYVFLMKKSAAIVTDVGGLTSHAAIVSRELQKPCLVGTKIATQVLKDGDLVEVDADKGVVKTLKKN